jgi:hypothetical protein
MEWSGIVKVATAVFQLIFMAFFATGLTDVAKDIYTWIRQSLNGFANKFRISKVTLTEDQLYLSGGAAKFLAFAIGIWMCYALDYGALANIIGLGDKARQGQAALIDYMATASIIRLGAGGTFDVLTMLTTKLQAAKTIAAQLVACPPAPTVTQTQQTTETTQTIETKRTVDGVKVDPANPTEVN